MKSPIRWLGGKGMMTAKILPLLPLCKRYVEVFGGGASLLLARSPVEIETYNDLDQALVDFFKVISDPKLFKKFKRRVEALPYSRQLWFEYRDTWKDQKNKVERVARWFLVIRQSFGSFFGASWGFSSSTSRKRMASTCSNWMSVIEILPQIHARLQRVQIENNDWRKVIKAHDSKTTLFYLDPPYIPDTRKAGGYEHEMTLEDHKEMVQVLLEIKGQAALSGYPHKTYSPLDKSSEWERYKWKTVCFAAAKTKKTKIQGTGAATKKQPRTECLWVKRNKTRLMKGFGL